MNDNFEGKWPQSKRDALIRLLDDDDPEISKIHDVDSDVSTAPELEVQRVFLE